MKIKRFTVLLFIFSFIYLELMLRINSHFSIIYPGIVCTVLIAAALGMLVYLLSFNYVISIVLIEAAVVWYLIAFFTNDTYFVFMSPGIIGNATTGVVTEFQSQLIAVIKNGVVTIILYHLPVIILLALRKVVTTQSRRTFKSVVIILLLTLILGAGGFASNLRSDLLTAKMTKEYVYDSAVRNFGVGPALLLDIKSNVIKSNVGNTPQFSTSEDVSAANITDSVSESDTQAGNDKEDVPKYEYNILDIDFSALANDESRSQSVKAIDNYVNSREPSKKNDYTGIFEGKNLILICAESFTKELIDEERTPVLYRLANNGIVFEDYYQPFWGGSTTTGEYSFLMGIIPTDANATEMTIGNNLYLTIGNQLKREGYTSVAYHNGMFDYYSRNLTHCNFGYNEFIAMGTGMEKGVYTQRYESDAEMFEYTIPQYIDKQPFSIYYMTISGHLNYSIYNGNVMCEKNWNAVADMDTSFPVKCYYSCNMEIEYALEELINQLEENNLMNDTVIVLTSDHYPYGLMKSAAWGNEIDYIDGLYGYNPENNPERDHNQAIIWCGSLEQSEPIIISDPTYSLDLLPTLSNLFGVEYDSRLMVGRDVLSDTEALVLWSDGSWLTTKGYYDGTTHEFEPKDDAVYNDDYVKSVCNKVTDMMTFSDFVLKNDYYATLFS